MWSRVVIACACLLVAWPLFTCASDVIPLTNADFSNKVTTDQPWFVEFYAPWCSHCKELAPKWEQLATELKGITNFASVDGTIQHPLMTKYNVRGFPTLLLFTGGHSSTPIEFKRERNLVELKKFLEDNGVNPKITLRYFTTRGRAETIRLALEVAKVPYEQELYTSEQWPAVKEKGIKDGLFAFGQLPALSYGNLHLAQSQAILKFLGRKLGLYPAGDPVHVDIILGGVEDWRTKYGELVYNPKFATEKTRYIEETMPLWMGYFEKLLQGKKYFIGDSLTVADLGVYDIIAANNAIDKNVLSEFPALNALYNHIDNLPAIVAYKNSERRPKYQNGARALFDNEANPAPKDEI